MILLILKILLLTLLLGLLSPSLLLPNQRAGKASGGWSHLARAFICQSRFLWSELLLQEGEKDITGILEKSADLYLLIFRVISEGKYLHAIDITGLADSLCSRCHSLPTEQHRNMTSGMTLETLIIITRTPWSPHPRGWQLISLSTTAGPTCNDSCSWHKTR